MASFQDLGLREPLLAALEDAGIERPTALQQAAIPVLRREGNLVARAGSGSGKTLAYGLGILDRLEPRATADEDEGDDAADDTPRGTRLLILAPTAEAAERAALELVPFAQAAGLTVSASGGGWGTRTEAAEVLAATPAEVVEAVRASAIKLEGVEAVVVDGAAEIESVGGWEGLETLFDHVPRDAQRVIITSQTTDAIDDLAGRRVKRAIRFPATAADPKSAEPAPEPTATVGYVPVSERDKLDTVARILGGGGGGEPPVLYCRTDERAAQVSEALTLRGFLASDAGDPDADVIVIGSSGMDEDEAPSGQVISYDVPADEETLRTRHGGEDPGFVLVDPRELGHLRDIAGRAGFFAQPAGIQGEEPVSGSLELRTFRGELRRALREEDLAAQMLILEPLFEDFTPTEIAAAASALLRKRRAAAPSAAVTAADAMPAAAAAARERTTARMARPAPGGFAETGGGAGATFTRLFVSLGDRDGVRAGDIVGAIAGEADLPGSSIGKVDIRDTFSIVEVPADAAERVIASLNGTTIRNRSVRVDYDRQRKPAGGPGAGRGGPGGGGMRRMNRPGPGGDDRGPRRPSSRDDDRPRRSSRDDDRPPRRGGDDRGGPRGPRSGPPRGGGGRPGGGGGGGFRRPRDD
ncbi:DEAD/DEAH box helicase [Longimicrobium sp.]|uniref:DEAD/DEAH box helicase n=1 Tax=Longimicrobium sp. TaxID=2029185 RepID=UPI002E364703|nr:DEAD/DEAH box helicase [Longimicrobium sp.]HEX6041919.1 DEAD/DEAH box helicase [Longimicrobium sp.]